MNDPLLVRGLQSFGNLLRDGQRLIEWQWPLCDPIRQRRSFDQFQDERMRAATVLEAVDGRDVRMIQRGEYLSLAPEANESIGISRDGVREDFQRDVAIELRVAGAVDLAHTAGADLRGDFVWAEASARSQGHSCWQFYAIGPE